MKILLLLLSLAPIFLNGVTVNDTLTNQAETILTELNDKDQFSGVVMLAKDGKSLYTKTIGNASKEFSEPNRRHTKFNLGSVSSLFPLIAICQLIDQGKLSLDDSVNKFVNAKFLPKVNLNNLKIIHLLTNTSGLGDFYQSQMRGGLSLWERSNKSLFTTTHDYLQLARTESSIFTPGSQQQPSPTAILLLAAIIEDITKLPFYRYVHENIFSFADMDETSYYTLSSPVNNIATGYQRKETYWVNDLYTRADRGSAAYACYTTVDDLLKFFRAFYDLKLTSRQMHDKILTPYMRLSNPTLSHQGVGPSNSYQGMLFELTYPNTDRATPATDTKLDPNGIKDLPSHHFVATLNSESETLSVTIDVIEPTGYLTIILSNYGKLGKKPTESPSMRIATKLRRFLFNSIRNGAIKQPTTLPTLPTIETTF